VIERQRFLCAKYQLHGKIKGHYPRTFGLHPAAVVVVVVDANRG